MNTQDERFEEVFKKSIQTMHDINAKQFGVSMANMMLPALEQMKPVFKIIYEQGLDDSCKKLEGCVVVHVEDILNLKRRIEQRYTNANEAINAEGWNPTISGHLDALDWAEQDISEFLRTYVADVEAARGGNE
ncbi:hypothetical protein NCZ17_00710 [Acinetobacter modestus]|uniref:hypothetical protein n=1 Tax=Acinetobacter modestus TaxID=1776740 RepID=UPI00202F58C1|nr:hypothetical protein [Acinetobacter modestus]MCM1957892.1 hypothetical protein [Acinetobacter modestus]